MQKRELTKKVKIGNITLGGDNKVLIQSMCDIKTSKVNEVIEEINKCASLGASLMRVSILDEEDAYSLKEIKKHINIPLVADIHFSANLAILAMENGADKIRINPTNTKKEDLIKIINKAKEYNVAIRIGINEGSTTPDGKNIKSIKGLIELAKSTISFFEDNGFTNLVISIKSSDTLKTIKIYERLAKITSYPLHIGVTESGFDDIGIIRSTIALSNLLIKGIGNTVRISLTKNPELEVLTCKRLLHDLNLYEDYPTIVACPTCGRCKVDNIADISKNITKYLEDNHKNLKVAIMGCIVNGIGEGKNSDIGIAGADHKFIIFKKGKILKTVDEKDLYEELKREINLL